jgi:hypothetical protein
MEDNPFPDSAVHGALLNTGVIASYRNSKSRLALVVRGTVPPHPASEGVQGACSMRIATVSY